MTAHIIPWARSLGAHEWAPTPHQVLELLAQLDEPGVERPLADVLCWSADLLPMGGLSVGELSEVLGAELSALARMLACKLPPPHSESKEPSQYWRIVARGPRTLRAVAVARWLVWQQVDANDGRPELAAALAADVMGTCDDMPRLYAACVACSPEATL